MTKDFRQLREFRETGSEEAFAAIVNRRIDLVYSVAFRQVDGDVQLARDICQEVFVILARKAGSLSDQVVLTGWLYRCVRFEAQRTLKRERRRHIREQEAYDMRDHQEVSKVDWETARPLLDKAIGELRDKDRDAICLRFFDNRSFSEIGAQLNLGENAARMRVNRALDKLGALLARDGIKSSSVALGLAIGGQACLAAPTGLSTAVTHSAWVGVAAKTSGSALSGAIGIMNTTKATIGWVSVVSALAVGTAIYQATQLEAAREDLKAAESDRRSYHSRLGDLDELRVRLAELDDEWDRLNRVGLGETNTIAPSHGFEAEEFESELEAWVTRVDNLAEYLSQNPQYRIPELDQIDVGIWLSAVRGDRRLKTEADFRSALSGLRMSAKHEWFSRFSDTMEAYLKDSGNILPRHALELSAYLDEEIAEAVLARYRIDHSHGEDFSKIENGTVVMREEPVDPLWDYQMHYAKGGSGFTYNRAGDSLTSAVFRFSRERGRDPENGQELEPFISDKSALEFFSIYMKAKNTPISFNTFEEQK